MCCIALARALLTRPQRPMRDRIAQEILDTERAYVNFLQIVVRATAAPGAVARRPHLRREARRRHRVTRLACRTRSTFSRSRSTP